jgi:hypothetical protein
MHTLQSADNYVYIIWYNACFAVDDGSFMIPKFVVVLVTKVA